MGLIASMCYFTAGTERRFHEVDEDMEELNIVIKYEKLINLPVLAETFRQLR